jgi:hypothetical protein
MAGRCDPPAFLPVRPITQVHLAAVTERARRRVIRWFKRRGFLDTAAAVELTPFEFLDRLADLVPPPRKHRHRYHGGFAPNHKLRPAERLGRGRAGPRRPDNLSGVARRAARDRHPQLVTGVGRKSPKPRDRRTVGTAHRLIMVGTSSETRISCTRRRLSSSKRSKELATASWQMPIRASAVLIPTTIRPGMRPTS